MKLLLRILYHSLPDPFSHVPTTVYKPNLPTSEIDDCSGKVLKYSAILIVLIYKRLKVWEVLLQPETPLYSGNSLTLNLITQNS